MNQLIDINELTERLLPITYFRRNAGSVIKKLKNVGTIILTKDGEPVAQLSALSKKGETGIEENIKKLKKLAGGYRLGPMSPQKIKKIIMQQYESVLP